MSVDRVVIALAGTFIWIGLILWYVTQNDWWLLIPAFVGANLFQSSFTGFCPLANMLKKIGIKPGPAFD